MKKIILFLGAFLVLMAFTQATIEISSSSIQVNYTGGGTISGIIEMGLENEPVDTSVEDSEGTTLTLLDFLKKTLYEYTCSPVNCYSSYSPSSEVSGESINLVAGEEKVFGLKYLGTIRGVLELSFNISSDAGESVSNQLKIDILNDGTFETGNTKTSVNDASVEILGCFDDELRSNSVEVEIDTLYQYCQRVNLRESPGFRIGAWVKKDSATTTSNVTMSLHSTNGVERAKCNILANQITQSGEFTTCNIDYLVSEKEDYYVCIIKEGPADAYKTRVGISSKESDKCGFKGTPGATNEDVSYEIGAVEKKFAAIGELEIKNELQDMSTLSLLIENYITEEFDNDCSEGCYVPIKIKSAVDQTIEIKNIISKYDLGGITTVDEIFEMDKESATITSELNNFSIDNIFEIENKKGTRYYSLKIGSEEVFDKKINVKVGEFKLFPEVAVSGAPTEFRIISDINETMKGYFWNFGDNSTTEKTINPSIIHSYKKIGEYTLSVTLTDNNDNNITKAFSVSVSSAKDLVDSELSRMKSSLTSISSVVRLSLTEYEKTKLLESVNIDSLLESVNKIESELGEDPTPEEYGLALEDLLLLDVPNELIRTDFESVPFFPLIGEIDVEVIKDITEEVDVKGTDAGIRNAVTLWSKNSIKVSIQKSEMSLNWKNQDELLLKTFKLDLTPRVPIEEYYLIFDSGTLSSDDANVVVGINGKSYIKIPGKRKSVNLFTQVDISFSELPIVVSPKISDLNIVDIEIKEADEPINKPMWIFVGILFAILIGFIIYLGLKYWYRTKYERHLFKDRNTLYNVMLYVNKQIKEGISVSEIRENLKKSGWSSEQIRYILRKYEGRETGMPGLGFGSDKIKAPPVQENSNKNMFENRKYKP